MTQLVNRLAGIVKWLNENPDNPQWEGVWGYYERLRDVVYPQG